MHEDSFDLPARAVLLMRNDACANQPSAGTHDLRLPVPSRGNGGEARNSRAIAGRLQRHFGAGAEAEEARVIAEVEAHYATGEYFCRTVTERWLDLVADCRAVAAEKRRRRAA